MTHSMKPFVLLLAFVLLSGAPLGCGDDDGNGKESALLFDLCVAGRPPDAQCYATKRDPGSENVALARAIADKQIEEHPPNRLKWDWGEAVMMVGVHELYRVTGEIEYRDYYKNWIDYYIDIGYLMGNSDTSAPARLALELYVQTGEAKYAQVLEDFRDYLYDRAPRIPEGGINHLGVVPIMGIWADSLFMFGGVLTRLGETQNDTRALAEFAGQHRIFTALLQEEPGWYKHAYTEAWPQDDDVYWGRGNGWVTVATYDYLRALLLRGESDEEAQAAIERQVAAILPSQDADSGLWWTVVNRPGESYLETSSAALFAYGLARAYRYGMQDASVLPAIRHAMQGVRSRITTDEQGRPVVTGVSAPTDVGTFAYYASLPTVDDISYGLGTVMLALVETSGLPEAP